MRLEVLVRLGLLAVIGFLPVAGAANPGLQREREYVVTADGLPKPLLEEIDLRGAGRNGNSVRFIARKTKGRDTVVSVSAYLNGKTLGSVNLSEGEFPYIDLSTALVGYDEKSHLQIEFRYGDAREECFVNDNAKNIITISFKKGSKPVVYDTSFADCGSNTRTLPQE